MPGKLKAKIVAGRHLPVMDRASDLTDAFVEVSDALDVWTLSLKCHIFFMSMVSFFSAEVWKYNFQNRRLSQIPQSTVELWVVQIWGKWLPFKPLSLKLACFTSFT